MRQQRASKVHEDRFPLSHSHGEHKSKDELVKRDMLDPPRYLRRTEDIRGKALSFGVLDWKQLDKFKDNTAEGTKGGSCSYASSYSGSIEASVCSLELDLATGVVKRLEQEHQASRYKQEQRKASEISSCTSPPCPLIFSSQISSELESSSKLLSDMLHDVYGECSNPVNVMERNQISVEKLHLDRSRGRHASPNRRFSFSFSQMSRSFSSKESSSSVPELSSSSHGSAKSGPLTFNDILHANPSTRTKPSSHIRTKSGPLLQMASKPSKPRPPTMEKNQSSSRIRALLQFTLRKGINLFQFVVDNNKNNVLAATMKSSDSSTQSYTLYTVKEVKNKTSNWLSRHRNDHQFVHTIIGQIKTVTSFTSDLDTQKSESVLFGVETNEEVAAIVQTRNKSQKHITTTIILPSGFHTLVKDSNAPLPLLDRWKSGGNCDCGGWDIGCKLRVLSTDYTKSQSFSSFQLFDQERDQPAFTMVKHDDGLHSVEFGSSISLLEAFFISLAVSSHQNWCADEEEEEAVLIGDGSLKRETSKKYASNPPVSPIGRV